jgi:hypothetical protein
LTDIKAVETPADRSAFVVVLESMYRFTLGSIAGGRYQSGLVITVRMCTPIFLLS